MTAEPPAISQAPETQADRVRLLRALGVDPGEIVTAEPLPGGLAGASLERLTLRTVAPSDASSYRRRIVKWLALECSWLGVASRDTRLREIQLVESGLLRELPHGIATAVRRTDARLTAEGQPHTGALLMCDMQGHLLRDPVRTPPGRLPEGVLVLLDRLAHMHARFWLDRRLADPTLGLVPADAALLLVAPNTIRARIVAGDDDPYLALAAAGWEAFFALADPAHTAMLQSVLRTPQSWLAVTASLPWTLVHGDVWGPNLGWLPATHVAPRRGPRLLLLDWALATAGPATYDPLWLCGTWHALTPTRVLAVYRSRLTRHLAARGIQLMPETWRALADAGYLRTALTCGEALGRAAADAPPGAARRRAEQRVRWWARRAAQAAARLAP